MRVLWTIAGALVLRWHDFRCKREFRHVHRYWRFTILVRYPSVRAALKEGRR